MYRVGRPPPGLGDMVSLKVDNLTYRTSPETLKKEFMKFGDVGDVYIPKDKHSKESRGFAFVRFYDRRDAEDAMDSMDGAMLDGRELRVAMARYARPTENYRERRRNDYRRSYDRRLQGRSWNRRRSFSRSRSRERRRYSRSRSRSGSRSRSRSRSRRSHSRSRKSRSRSRRSRSRSRRSRSRSRSNERRKKRRRSRSRSRSRSSRSSRSSTD